MAFIFTANANWYLNYGNGTTTGYWAIPPWSANTAVTVGTIRRPTNPTVGLERLFICAVAGTTHATTEPVWGIYRGTVNLDNGIKWFDCTGLNAMNGDVANAFLRPDTYGNISTGVIIKRNNGASYQICTTSGFTGGNAEPAFSDVAGVTTYDGATWTSLGPVSNYPAWGAPAARLNTLTSYADQRMIGGGNTVYVSHQHAETSTLTTTIEQWGQYYSTDHFKVLCVNSAGSMPPVLADLRTTASIAVTGSNNLAVRFQNTYYYGITFAIGSGTTSGYIDMQSSTSCIYENCSFRKFGTANISYVFTLGSGKHIGTTFQFGLVSDMINFNSGAVVNFFGGSNPNPIIGSVIPNFFIGNYGNSGQRVTATGLDLTVWGSGKTLTTVPASSVITLRNCKINSAVTLWNANDVNGQYYGAMYLSQTDSGTGVKRNEKYSMQGAQITELVLVKTDGAKDDTVPVSWKATSRAYTVRLAPFQLMPLAAYSTAVATTVTATVVGMMNAAALPTNAEIWMEIDYLGNASNPQGTRIGNGFASVFSSATAHSSSTEAWDSLATARANSTAYTVGQVVKVSSNAGRVFFCITAGTSAASLPGGFAGAVDGGSVTDGGAVFRAAVRFAVALVLTSPQPAYAQLLTANLFIGKASTTYYIDPKLTLT